MGASFVCSTLPVIPISYCEGRIFDYRCWTKLIFTTFLWQKQDESLLEDVWTLIRAGRIEEACDLCRSAGQVICIRNRDSLKVMTRKV